MKSFVNTESIPNDAKVVAPAATLPLVEAPGEIFNAKQVAAVAAALDATINVRLRVLLSAVDVSV
jgi:hypothetical protein